MRDEEQERLRLEAQERDGEADWLAERENEKAIEYSRDACFFCPRGGEG